MPHSAPHLTPRGKRAGPPRKIVAIFRVPGERWPLVELECGHRARSYGKRVSRCAECAKQYGGKGQLFHWAIEVASGGCWEWTGCLDARGYGKVGRGGGSPMMAHRVSYEHYKGPIPKGLLVCHACDNPRCCNPDHLFLGTQSDNLADASNKGRLSNRFGGQSQSHCINGHEFTPENTYQRPGSLAGRDCRACIRARVAAYQKRKAAA